MRKFVLACAVAGMLTVSMSAQAEAHPAKGDGGWRTWKISYNSALSLHEAAVPSRYAKPGTKLRIEYRGKSLVVHAIAGGCRCFDISDEGMNRLASTSQGVIKAKVKRV